MTITFTITATPKSASRPRIFRNGGRSYSKSHTEYERLLQTELRQYSPQQPLEGCVAVHMVFVFPQLKTKTAAYPKSDLDNLAKLPLDVMTKLSFWHDDSQVTQLSLSKRFVTEGEQPHTTISITKL